MKTKSNYKIFLGIVMATIVSICFLTAGVLTQNKQFRAQQKIKISLKKPIVFPSVFFIGVFKS